MPPILIPKHMQTDVGSLVHWDACFIDLKLKDGRVKRRIMAREGVAIESSLTHPPNEENNLDFKSEDIVAVRPTSAVIPFFVTELIRSWRRPQHD